MMDKLKRRWKPTVAQSATIPELSAGGQIIPLDVDGHFVIVLQSTRSP